MIHPQTQKQVWLVGVFPIHVSGIYSAGCPHFPTSTCKSLFLFLLAAFVSVSSTFIFFTYTFCFSFREPLPRPAIWFSFKKKSVEGAETAGGVPAHDCLLMGPLELELLPGREGLRSSWEQERGIPEKVQAGHTPH